MDPELLQSICQSLVNVLQGDEDIRKTAEQQMKVYFRSPGFHSVLHV
jgi:hypothetical protein